MRWRTSGGSACIAFRVSSGVIARFNESGTGACCPEACLRIGSGVGEGLVEAVAAAGDTAGAAAAGDCDEAPDCPD